MAEDFGGNKNPSKGTQKNGGFMSNPYITSAQELAAFIRSSDNTLKSRPIWGVSGLSIIKEGARWSFHFKHVGWGAKFGPEGSSIIGSPSGNPE